MKLETDREFRIPFDISDFSLALDIPRTISVKMKNESKQFPPIGLPVCQMKIFCNYEINSKIFSREKSNNFETVHFFPGVC